MEIGGPLVRLDWVVRFCAGTFLMMHIRLYGVCAFFYQVVGELGFEQVWVYSMARRGPLLPFLEMDVE